MKQSTLWIIGIILALVGYKLIAPATPRTITTTGECLTTAPRDRTAITLRVTTLDKNALKSMRDATTRIAEINTYLENLDVKTQTTEFNSYEKTEWNHTTQKSINMGTETTIAIEVSADNMDIIEQILNQFAGQENIYVGNLQMFSSRETLQPIVQDCMSTAVENARIRAAALAAGDKSRVGKMLAVSYGTNGNTTGPNANYRLTSMAKAETMDAGAFGTLSARDTNISVSVSATFEIK